MRQPSSQNFESRSSNSEITTREIALDAAADSESFRNFLQFLKKRAWLIAVGIALGIAAGITANILLPKLYTTQADIEVAEDISSQFRLEQMQDFTGGDESEKLDTEIEILRSPSLVLETIRALHLESNPDFVPLKDGRPWNLSSPAVRQSLIGSFLANLRVERLGHTTIIQIFYTSKQPRLASLIANTLIDRYIEHSFRDNYEATAKVSGWLDSRLSGLKDNLEKSQAHILALQKDVGIYGLDRTNSVTVADLEELTKQYADAQVDRLLKESELRAIKSSTPDVIDAGAAALDPALQSNRVNLTQLQTQYASLIQTYGAAYPRVKDLHAQIVQLEQTVKQQEDAQIARTQKAFDAAENNEMMLRKTLDAQEQQAFSKGEQAMQYELARRDYETNRLLYDGLQERLQESGIMAGLHSTATHVVDNADIPAYPSHPRTGLNLAIGGAAGLLLGFGFALLLEAMDTNLKDMDEIENVLRLPMLAALPRAQGENLVPTNFAASAISQGGGEWSRIAEALRGMRTSILLSSPGSPPKVLMVTSTRPGEGKSSVSTLAAITFALNGARVLLVDADLRRPVVNMRFKIGNGTGLSSVLSGKATFREAIVQWEQLPNLYILPSGPVPPLPSELLGSKQMEDLLAELRAEYDFVIIDTPPALAVTDSAIVGRLSDAVVLILRYATSQRQVVQRTIDLLDRSGAHLLGVVVNAVNIKAPEYKEYYGRKYDQYYAEQERD